MSLGLNTYPAVRIYIKKNDPRVLKWKGREENSFLLSKFDNPTVFKKALLIADAHGGNDCG